MQVIKLKNYKGEMQVLINGKPNFKLIEEEEMDITAIGLEMQMSEYFKKKRWSTKKVKPP